MKVPNYNSPIDMTSRGLTLGLYWNISFRYSGIIWAQTTKYFLFDSMHVDFACVPQNSGD